MDVEFPPKVTRPKVGVARFAFQGRPAILVKEFGTQRKAGWWVLAEGDDGPLEGLGPEPFSDEFEDAADGGEDSKKRLHSYLRNQRTVAGIGRGYADEILHDAKSVALRGDGEPLRGGEVAATHLDPGDARSRARAGTRSGPAGSPRS